MLAKGYLPILPNLFEPRQAVAVRCQARYYVIKAVPVNVINLHLGATSPKVCFMFNPNGIVRQRLGLFPPAIFLKQIRPSIAIDITAPQPVGKPLPVTFWG